MTSHAAIIARGLDTCCVIGCNGIAVDENNKKFTLNGKTFKEGDFISIDGNSGKIYDSIIPTVLEPISDDYYRVMAWAEKYRK